MRISAALAVDDGMAAETGNQKKAWTLQNKEKLSCAGQKPDTVTGIQVKCLLSILTKDSEP